MLDEIDYDEYAYEVVILGNTIIYRSYQQEGEAKETTLTKNVNGEDSIVQVDRLNSASRLVIELYW